MRTTLHKLQGENLDKLGLETVKEVPNFDNYLI